MFDEHVEFLEGILVQQDIEPFARSELSLGVLGIYPAFATTEARGLAFFLKLTDDVVH